MRIEPEQLLKSIVRQRSAVSFFHMTLPPFPGVYRV